MPQPTIALPACGSARKLCRSGWPPRRRIRGLLASWTLWLALATAAMLVQVAGAQVASAQARESQVRESQVRESQVREAQVREAQVREAQVREAQAPEAPDFERDVRPFLTAYCVQCHNEQTREGDFRIDSLSARVGVEDTPQWAEVMERISSGEMPPEDAPKKPTADQGAAVVEWLAARIREGESARMARRDRVSFLRLSREEYVHSLYDLLGVQFDAEDPGGLTEDPDWHGFERLGPVLTLSASHIEKYFQAAETVLAEAYPEREAAPIDERKPAVPDNHITGGYREYLEARGLLDKVRFEMWPGDVFRYGKPNRLPAAGVYEVTIRLSGLKPPEGPAPRLKVYHDNLDRVLFEQDIVAAEDQPITVRFQTHLPAGSHNILMYNEVPGPSVLPRSGRHGRKPFLSLKEGRIPWQLKLTDEDGEPLYPFLILDEVRWQGPLVTPRQRQLRDDYMPAEDGNLQQARAGLERLATRAFRRPLRDGELEPYLGIVRGELAAGSDFRSAIKAAIQAILCSRHFLFLHEGSEDQPRHTLNDWEIASRLSYFLWSTMPDEELFSLAREGKLSDPQVRREQAQRMLADPRAERFSASFARQWLQLRKVGMFPPDKRLYPDYDQHLEQSMIGETTAFFHDVLRRNLSLREFLDSDWTMLNPRLARHYGLQPPEQDVFQRVVLRPEDQRGGLLTQAAILSLTSDGTRHRPVHRGVWLSESILGTSPPPPPANVDPIEPNPVDSPKATLRMKLDAHKSDPNCASCHRKIDPLGLAFENYDAIGRWRTREAVPQGTGDDPPVDASGVLPDGRSFSNAREFKQHLLDDLDRFQLTFIEKLATYGLRRAVSFEDQDEVAGIAERSRKSDYRLRSLIEEFVASELFQQR